jgi:hypothetical protein
MTTTIGARSRALPERRRSSVLRPVTVAAGSCSRAFRAKKHTARSSGTSMTRSGPMHHTDLAGGPERPTSDMRKIDERVRDPVIIRGFGLFSHSEVRWRPLRFAEVRPEVVELLPRLLPQETRILHPGTA